MKEKKEFVLTGLACANCAAKIEEQLNRLPGVSGCLLYTSIYTGTIYSAKPIIAKDQFKDFASQLAVGSMQKTGMSAALQTAQAILETGWGQSSPVDKYSGQMSNNLFGIKGKGPAGSVTSNTWEEYNGTTFRVDAAFRAYKSPAESWDDHKSLLLNAARYAPCLLYTSRCV